MLLALTLTSCGPPRPTVGLPPTSDPTTPWLSLLVDETTRVRVVDAEGAILGDFLGAGGGRRWFRAPGEHYLFVDVEDSTAPVIIPLELQGTEMLIHIEQAGRLEVVVAQPDPRVTLEPVPESNAAFRIVNGTAERIVPHWMRVDRERVRVGGVERFRQIAILADDGVRAVMQPRGLRCGNVLSVGPLGIASGATGFVDWSVVARRESYPDAMPSDVFVLFAAEGQPPAEEHGDGWSTTRVSAAHERLR